MENNNTNKTTIINGDVKIVINEKGKIEKIEVKELRDLIGTEIKSSEGEFKIKDGAYINYHGLITM